MGDLRALAEKIEQGHGNRDLDADIYEAFGFQVKRAPEGRNGISWRYLHIPNRNWVSLAHLTTSIDECSRFIEKLHRNWAWNVGNTGPNDEPHACITLNNDDCTDVEGSASVAARALAAALCRAVAVEAGQ